MTLQDSNDIISVSKGLRYNYPLKIQYGYPVVSQLHDSTRKPEGQSLRLFFLSSFKLVRRSPLLPFRRKHAAQSKSLKQNFLVLRSLGAQKILKKLVRPNCKPRKGRKTQILFSLRPINQQPYCIQVIRCYPVADQPPPRPANLGGERKEVTSPISFWLSHQPLRRSLLLLDRCDSSFFAVFSSLFRLLSAPQPKFF